MLYHAPDKRVDEPTPLPTCANITPPESTLKLFRYREVAYRHALPSPPGRAGPATQPSLQQPGDSFTIIQQSTHWHLQFHTKLTDSLQIRPFLGCASPSPSTSSLLPFPLPHRHRPLKHEMALCRATSLALCGTKPCRATHRHDGYGSRPGMEAKEPRQDSWGAATEGWKHSATSTKSTHPLPDTRPKHSIKLQCEFNPI